MDILVVEKEKETYLGNFINNYYSVFIDIFNKSSTFDKLLLIFIRLIDVFLILIVILGFLLPKNLSIWHIVACFVVLCYVVSADNYNGDYDFTFISNATFTILKRNNVNIGYSNEQLLNASKFIPIQNKTIALFVSILMLISILGYIYPNYSANTLLYKLLGKLNLIDKSKEDKVMHSINPDFNLGYKNNTQELKTIQEVKNDNLNQNQDGGEVPIEKIEIQTMQYQPSNTEISNSNQYDVNINKVDSGLSVFNKIEPIKIKTKPDLVGGDIIGKETLKTDGDIANTNKLTNKIEVEEVVEIPAVSTVKNTGNNKFIEKDLNLNLNSNKEINKEQLYNSLKKFNNII